MEKEELILDMSTYEASEEMYDSLREAVNRLATASEEQFEEIKKEKWYNRVFDLITFSQKGKKRIAEQIGTIAQAQQIIIDILLRLSDRDANVSKIVRQSMNDIKKISEQNIYLLDRIKRLENISLGIKYNNDISGLSTRNKEILSGCLYCISSIDDPTTEEQKAYANAILKYIDTDARVENLALALANIDNESKRKIFTCCKEYVFLKTYENNIPDQLDEFFEEFDFGNKTVREIDTQIEELYKLRGFNGFINKYQSENYDAIKDEFYFEYESEPDSVDKEDFELSDMAISSILQIRENEAKLFQYNTIHISAYITCEGILEFDHCVIYYNETGEADEIVLGENASLKITNSVIISKAYDESIFISSKRGGTVTFENCTFENCANFLALSSSNGFVLRNCKIRDCYDKFVDIYMGDGAYCEITENEIKENCIAPFNFKREKEHDIFLFSITNYNGEAAKCRFYNNTIIETDNFRTAWREDDKVNEICYVKASGVEIRNSTFIGATNCLNASHVLECSFKNCKKVIDTRMKTEKQEIDNCLFNNCTSVLLIGNNARITNCQFIGCYNEIINTHSFRGFTRGICYGGVLIEFCEFIKVKVNNEEFNMWDGWPKDSCITFEVFGTNRKNNRSNYIRKCIFNGIDVDEKFLISTSLIENEKPNDIITYIEECDFRNCSTRRRSGKIIKENMQYDTLFKKGESAKVTSIRDCKGLDKVNKESGQEEEIKIKTESTAGNPIGSLFAPTVLDGLGRSMDGPFGWIMVER